MECIVSSKLRRLLAIALFLACGIMSSIAIESERLASPITSSPAAYQSIRQDLNNGRADDAISLLQKQLSENSANAAAHHLLCRVYLQEERWPDAEKECGEAVELDPNNSAYHQWLGRAYGGAAAHASLASAYKLAKKVHAEFETAVQLDPQNVSALSDLGEYLIDVPRILGGGVAHAEQIAQQLAPLDAARFSRTAGEDRREKIGLSQRGTAMEAGNPKFAKAGRPMDESGWVLCGAKEFSGDAAGDSQRHSG